MSYFFLISISLAGTGIAWKRIFEKNGFWGIKVGYLVLSMIPIAGPIFYFLIDPPESSPIAVSPEKFRTAKDPRVLTSFNPLINSLRKLFGKSRP